MSRVVVIGAGVIGLCTAIRLREHGVDARVIARDRTPHTTSDQAAAIFFPFGVGPWTRVVGWARATLDEFERIRQDPEAGIHDVDLIEVYDQRVDEPWWAELMRSYHRVSANDLPADYVDGFATTTPLIEMPKYMPYLEHRLEESGGSIEQQEIGRLEDLKSEADVVVNCTGVWAHHVAPDPSVFPLRGQTVRLSNPGLDRAIIDELTSRALAHTIPRSGDVVCGGTLDRGNWDQDPDADVEQTILEKVRLLEPALADASILGRGVGLRPGRKEIRLDVERRGRLWVVHNYGHAGAGVSLSWGCADEAAGLVRSLLDR